jgi:hypothetical protein
MRRLLILAALLPAMGCGSSRHAWFRADVLAPERIDAAEQRELVSLGKTVFASGWRHHLLLFVPLGSRPDIEAIVREAVGQVPGATALIDAEVNYGDVDLGPVALVWVGTYVRVTGTAAARPAPASR